MGKYKYQKLLPLNKRIRFQWDDNITFLQMNQLDATVYIAVSNFDSAKLIAYKKNKIKIHFKLANSSKNYIFKITNKVPRECRESVKAIGTIYYYHKYKKYIFETVFFYHNCIEISNRVHRELAHPPSYSESQTQSQIESQTQLQIQSQIETQRHPQIQPHYQYIAYEHRVSSEV